MPTTAPPPSHEPPSVEARLRAELGRGAVPEDVRRRHHARLRQAADRLRAQDEGAAADASSVHAAAPTTPGTPGSARAGAERRWSLPGRLPRAAAAAGMAIVAVATLGTGAVAASGDALPGQALHGVKRAVEEARVVLAGSPAAEVDTTLAIAEARLDEAERLVEGEGGAEHLAGALDGHVEGLRRADRRAEEDPRARAEVRDAARAALPRLAGIVAALPASSLPEARAAADRAVRAAEGLLGPHDRPGAEPGPRRAPEPPSAEPGHAPPPAPQALPPHRRLPSAPAPAPPPPGPWSPSPSEDADERPAAPGEPDGRGDGPQGAEPEGAGHDDPDEPERSREGDAGADHEQGSTEAGEGESPGEQAGPSSPAPRTAPAPEGDAGADDGGQAPDAGP